MSIVRLDLSRLLGFRMIVTGEGRDVLHSPKIGSKALKIRDDTLDAIMNNAPIRAKIGVKVPRSASRYRSRS